ncbi:MAG TPA: glutamyl-tRNA reductase [Phycisphaerales bacterium]|nr:glutamyl-tRNA reductase [Phycisphaerales bacterium]
MKILLVGLNHKSAPVEVREKLAFDAPSTAGALGRLKERFADAEFVLLSTCNRVELYCADSRAAGVQPAQLVAFLAEYHGIDPQAFRDFLYVHEDEDAVRHLLMVTSSLDSMVVGEAQIIAQVKENYRLACAARTTGKVLNRLFHSAFYTSKKVYSTTAITGGRVSVAGVAVELAMQLFEDLSQASTLVIGAGQMGELIVQHLLELGCRDITVANRTFERARAMAQRYGIAAAPWESLAQGLSEANIAIASAAVQDYLYTRRDFAERVKRRRNNTLLIIDVAVPRNFDPAINKIEDVYLYSIDELAYVAEQNRKTREDDITAGLEIIYENAADFMDWFKARDIGPLIGRMKGEFTRISEHELQRFFAGVRCQANCRASADLMVHRIVGKLMHCVIKNVDIVAQKHGPAEAAKMVDEIVRHALDITATRAAFDHPGGMDPHDSDAHDKTP